MKFSTKIIAAVAGVASLWTAARYLTDDSRNMQSPKSGLEMAEVLIDSMLIKNDYVVTRSVRILPSKDGKPIVDFSAVKTLPEGLIRIIGDRHNGTISIIEKRSVFDPPPDDLERLPGWAAVGPVIARISGSCLNKDLLVSPIICAADLVEDVNASSGGVNMAPVDLGGNGVLSYVVKTDDGRLLYEVLDWQDGAREVIRPVTGVVIPRSASSGDIMSVLGHPGGLSDAKIAQIVAAIRACTTEMASCGQPWTPGGWWQQAPVTPRPAP